VKKPPLLTGEGWGEVRKPPLLTGEGWGEVKACKNQEVKKIYKNLQFSLLFTTVFQVGSYFSKQNIFTPRGLG